MASQIPGCGIHGPGKDAVPYVGAGRAACEGSAEHGQGSG